MQRALSLLMLLALASGLALGAEPAKMQTREFKVHLDLRAMARSLAAAKPAPGVMTGDPFGPPAAPSTPSTIPLGPDPFAGSELPLVLQPEKPPPLPSSKDLLAQMGISFPPGATSFYDASSGTLRVHHTPESLDLITALVQGANERLPCDIVFAVTVVEGPTEIIRQVNAATAHVDDATAELRKLLDQAKQPASKVRVVNDAWVVAQSGTRATTQSMQEHGHIGDLTFNAQGHASPKQERLPLGVKLELEPQLSEDGRAITTNLGLTLSLAPPVQHPLSIADPGQGNTADFSATDFFHAEFATVLHHSSRGSTRLLGVAAPESPGSKAAAPDERLWAIFVTATKHVQEPLPHSTLKPSPSAKAPPAGMQAAVFQVPEGLWVDDYDYYWPHPPRTVQDMLEARGLVSAKGASAVQKDGVLQIINTPDNIERTAQVVEKALEEAPKAIACTLHTVQVPAAFLRDLAHASAGASDHAEQWAQVEAAVARGEGRFINSVFVHAQSATKVRHVSAREHLHLEELGLNAKGRPVPGIASREVGSIFEIEPTLQPGSRSLQALVSYELHPAPPAAHREMFRDPASGLRFDLPVTDFHTTGTTTSLVIATGGTRLLSLHHPTGREDTTDMLWATFLKCDVVPQVLPSKDSAVASAETVPTDPKAWKTQTFRVPTDFLSVPDSKAGEDKSKRTAQSLLEASGILFPAGAAAVYDPLHCRLIVRNTQSNLDLVEAYVTGLDGPRWPSTVAYTAQIFQGPGPLLRQLTAQAASKCDHRAELDALEAALKAGTVRALGTSRIEARFGTRSRTTQARQHSSFCGIKVNDKGTTEIDQEVRDVGLTFEVEPSIRTDGRAIESTIGLEFHPAEPQEHREHVLDSQGHPMDLPLTDYQVFHFASGTPMASGTARLAALWKPTGKPEFEENDVLQILFITCDFHLLEP
ncbi:MAG: hypothetical protein J0L73_23775 [Verrucomicrobia bacterium]|nr:hypothetical protein [Verrucomicrobiota bacterium]